MVTSNECLKKYGDPSKETSMTAWVIPDNLHIGPFPKKLYCNKDLVEPLSKAFGYLIETGADKLIKTFDGCFNIRKKRGLSSQSLHSWGIAIDINASSNQLGQNPTMSPEVVECFKQAGFEWGGDWENRLDGMHFQLAKLP